MRESERHRVDEMLDLLAEEVADRLRTKFWLYSAREVDLPADSTTERERPDESLGEAGEPRAAAPEAGSGAPEAGSAGPEAGSAAAEAGYSTREERRAAPAAPEADREVSIEVGRALDAEPEKEPETEPEEAESERGLEPGLEPGPEASLEAGPEAGPQAEAPSSSPVPSHTARLLGRLALGLLVALVLINIPFNRHGTTLATAMPDNRALVIRNGLVVKEEDDPEIYVFENGEFRWISSLDAFQARGYTWEDVHIVEDGFLEDYAMGPPIHVLVKCNGSPHIYRVEGEKKRWIVDIEAFEAAGHVWEDVQFVSCATIRSLPNGETIPPGNGPAPEP